MRLQICCVKLPKGRVTTPIDLLLVRHAPLLQGRILSGCKWLRLKNFIVFYLQSLWSRVADLWCTHRLLLRLRTVKPAALKAAAAKAVRDDGHSSP